MKIALTGGSGSVGRAIIDEALRQGHSVVSIDRVAPEAPQPGVTYVTAEMSEYEKLVAAFAGCDGVIHMAAIPNPGRHPDYEVHNNNVVGSYNALRAAVENGITKICQASSVNAIGHSYSRVARYDYFPIDEDHPTYNEDPYSLSKWVCELQGDSFARRYDDLTIASMRFHWVVPNRELAAQNFNRPGQEQHLWAYTLHNAAARACLLVMTAGYKGHEVFFIIAPTSTSPRPSRELIDEFYPGRPIKGDMSGHNAFFSSRKAERLLGWKHDL